MLGAVWKMVNLLPWLESAWKLWNVVNTNQTTQQWAQHLAKIICKRDRIPHVDLFCRMISWENITQDTEILEWLHQQHKKGTFAKLEDIVWSREDSVLLEQCYYVLVNLTTEYCHSAYHLEDHSNKVKMETLAFWSSLTRSQSEDILSRYEAKDYHQLMDGNNSAQKDILQQWIVNQVEPLRSHLV